MLEHNHLLKIDHGLFQVLIRNHLTEYQMPSRNIGKLAKDGQGEL